MRNSPTLRWRVALTLALLLVLLTAGRGRTQVNVHGQLRVGATIASLDGPHWSGGYLAVTDRSSIRGVTGGVGVVIEGAGWTSPDISLKTGKGRAGLL